MEVWGNTYKTNLYSLFIKQKKAICIVCHAKYLDHTSSLFHKLRLLKSPDIVHFNTCIFMYKAFHNLLPPSIQIYFSRSFSKKFYFNFHVHFARTQRKKFSISRIGLSFWNALDTKVKLSCCCCRPHSTNVLPAESSTRIMWQPTVSPPRWQGKAPLCRDSSRGPG